MKYHIVTYGCQMNKSDSERIATLLENKGYQPAKDISRADLVVINMCSVRQKPVDKAKNQIARLRNKKIILIGCILDADKKEFAKMGVKIWRGLTSAKLAEVRPLTGFVPIMRGCNNFCSYCVVPYTRGPEKYRSQKEIIGEVKHLLKKGIKEITLLGQNVDSYKYKPPRDPSASPQDDNSVVNFVKLLQKITVLPGDFKIKFITNHPKDFSDELIDEIARNDKIIKYVHLPVQSGDNKILKKMNRNYTGEQYLALIKKIKKKIPNVDLTTDIIVGFPGETEKQFQKTVNLFKKIKFATAYIAKYSPRPGTVAYKLKDNVPLAEKKRREQTLRKLIPPTRHSEAKPKNLNQRDPSARYHSPQDDNNKLIVILGPTAVGKTEFSIKLAKKFNGQVISADSRQVYKGMNIGTGKISKKERQGIPHYLLDIASPRRRFSVAQYQKKAIEVINKILKKKKIPFLVGGSPFYIYSIVEGWVFPKMKADLKLRKELEKKSIEELFNILKKLSPQRAKTIEKKNKRRLIRAIEIAKALGKVLPLKKNPQFDCLLIGIKLTKEKLQKKVSQRVDKMIELGLEKEVKKLSEKYGFNSVLGESIGYQEWEKSGSRAAAEIAEEIKFNTYHLAKRQMTWFKKDKRILWVENYKQAENLIKNFLV